MRGRSGMDDDSEWEAGFGHYIYLKASKGSLRQRCPIRGGTSIMLLADPRRENASQMQRPIKSTKNLVKRRLETKNLYKEILAVETRNVYFRFKIQD